MNKSLSPQVLKFKKSPSILLGLFYCFEKIFESDHFKEKRATFYNRGK